MASLSTFSNFWISKAEYDEADPSIVLIELTMLLYIHCAIIISYSYPLHNNNDKISDANTSQIRIHYTLQVCE